MCQCVSRGFRIVSGEVLVSAIPIPNEDDQGHAIPQFVRAGTRFGSVGTAEFVEQPVRWRGQPLLMLLWSSTHLCGV